MKAVIYTRVSSKDQSTKRQLNDMKSIQGFDVVNIFAEKISAFSKSSSQRPGLQEAISYSKKK